MVIPPPPTQHTHTHTQYPWSGGWTWHSAQGTPCGDISAMCGQSFGYSTPSPPILGQALTMLPRLISNSLSSCLSLPTAGRVLP